MEASSRSRLVRAEQREEERVTPLELFFDLVFVLALTQCTALMAKTPVWEGLVKGLLVLGVLWWAWVGYAWLTSVVDPEAGAVRLAIFAAMAGFLVAALAIPNAFGDDGLIFAAAYAFVRIAHIWLFTIASRDDPGLRRSVVGLAASTSIGVTLLLVASATDGALQLVLWGLALGLDAAGPYLIGADGWKLMPAHFAERHGLILIIALGESIVAIGVGSNAVVDTGVIVAAVLGIAIAAAQWWIYFDVTVWVAERQFTEMEPGRDQNELARDAYSYIHFAMVAGIVLRRARREEDARARGRRPEDGAGSRTRRRRRPLPPGARGVQVAHPAHPLPDAPRQCPHPDRGPAARPRPARPRDARDRARRPLGAHRLRVLRLPRVPGARAPRARTRPRRRGRARVTEKLWAPWRLEYVVDRR